MPVPLQHTLRFFGHMAHHLEVPLQYGDPALRSESPASGSQRFEQFATLATIATPICAWQSWPRNPARMTLSLMGGLDLART